ncbi:hypothetical protein GCM10023206_28610 [Acinetobacter puyangensis]|uniref:Uncharacterized protein n=1 Tax=Acinetobacter puyangensis TaxID=1096779 RepID=A0A240E668_9GAMM|nr:hypothetical protein [Acinetobacter puyangensis]SNX43370.1 hypothetical protein SAMN05421731_101406 [Acinetobacter puyangensis]
MNTKTYDQKNAEDYEENTLKLKKSLLEIENNPSLKATIAQLSKMAGIHRNTITNRDWPLKHLQRIKEKRSSKDEENKKQRISDKTSLDEKLNQARQEVIYWFNQYQDIKLSFDHLHTQLKTQKESHAYYKNLYEEYQKKFLLAEQEIKRLKTLLESKGILPDLIKH